MGACSQNRPARALSRTRKALPQEVCLAVLRAAFLRRWTRVRQSAPLLPPRLDRARQYAFPLRPVRARVRSANMMRTPRATPASASGLRRFAEAAGPLARWSERRRACRARPPRCRRASSAVHRQTPDRPPLRATTPALPRHLRRSCGQGVAARRAWKALDPPRPSNQGLDHARNRKSRDVQDHERTRIDGL